MPDPADLADAADRRLLQRYLDGEVDAFGQLARANYDRLWPLALRMCGSDAEEAADALQDAFIAAMRGAAGFRGEAKVSTWLHRIVVNACLDRHRRQQRRPTAVSTDHAHELPDQRDRISEQELAWEVERALAGLPEDQRAAIVLVDVEGWPIAEAADLLGVPEGTVKSRCSRGRAKLAKDLAHLRNPPVPGSVEQGDRGSRPDASGVAGGGA